MIVIWSNNAKKDLLRFSQNNTKDYINSLINYIDNLENFSKLGKFLFKRNYLEIRQLIYHMHRIFYAINNNIVYILVISHTSQDVHPHIKYLKNKKSLFKNDVDEK